MIVCPSDDKLELICYGQRDHSMLTFETTAIQGTAGIVEKLAVRIAICRQGVDREQ